MPEDLQCGSALLRDFLLRVPYPVQVYAPDGTMVMVNEAFLHEFRVENENQIVGKYNILQDPTLTDQPFYTKLLAAFSGTATESRDLTVPVHFVKMLNGIPPKGLEALVVDISTVPVCDGKGTVVYVVNLLVPKRKLYSRSEIDLAKAYIEAHWQEEYSTEAVAKAVFLSTAHFSRIFRECTDMTPHEYHMSIKIDKIKDRLLDTNLSVEEAFAQCGVHYHGHFAALFKEKTGFTPMQYRKLAKK